MPDALTPPPPNRSSSSYSPHRPIEGAEGVNRPDPQPSAPTQSRRPLGLRAALALLAALAVFAAALPASNASPSQTKPAPIRPSEQPPLVKPTGLEATTEAGSLSVSVDWDDVAGADSYKVRWREGVRGTQLNDGDIVTESEAAITVTHHGTWVVKVFACRGPNCGPGQSTRFQVDPAPEPTPEPVAVVPVKATGLEISVQTGSLEASLDWDDVANADEYLIRWRRAGPGNPLNDGERHSSSDAVITLEGHGEWVVRVQACNSAGCGTHIARRFESVPPAQPNRAPVIDEGAEHYASFVGAQPAPAWVYVSKVYEGIFSDPDGDTLTYTVSVPDDRRQPVDSVLVQEHTQRVFIRLKAHDDLGAITPALPDPLVTTVTLTATDPEGLSVSVSGDFHTNWASHPKLESATAVGEAVVLEFDQDLQETPRPGRDQFTVNAANADGTAATIAVKYVGVRGNVVTLWLASAPESGQSLTVDYTHADAAPLKRAADGGDSAPDFTGHAVTSQSATAVPGKPLGFQVSHDFGLVVATWDEVPGAESYTVQSRMADGAWDDAEHNHGCLVYLCYPAGSIFVDAGDWEFRVAACNTSGCSAYVTKAFTVSPPRPKPPGRPSNVQVHFTDDDLTKKLTWNEKPGADSYRLSWRRAGEEPQPANVATIESTSATVSVSEIGEWTIDLQACNGAGCGHSVTQTVDFAVAPPTAPENLDVSVTPGILSFSATWDAVPTATSYVLRWRDVERGDNESSEQKVVDNTATISVSRYGTWELTLETCNAGGCGPSASIMTTIASTPEAIALVCERPRFVRDDLVDLVGKPCDAITFGDLAQVTSWEISGGGLEELQPWDFEGLTGLETLVWRGSPLSTLPEGAFDRLSGLRNLDLNLELTSLPDGVFDNLPNLEHLIVEHNPLRSLPSGVFDNLSGLQSLNLGFNGLTSLPSGVFDNLSGLQSLNLGFNGLTSLPSGVFDNLSGLQSLNFGFNGLTSLPSGEFDSLASLKSLNLSQNPMTTLPSDAFDGLTSLQELNLDGTELTTLPEGIFDDLSSLQTLNLTNNEFTSLPAGVFDGLSNLQMLNMWLNTRLTELPAGVFDDLSSLRLLYLSGAGLTSLPEGIFDDLSSLQALDLAEMDLKSLPAGVFDGLSNLEDLGLQSNKLTTLPAGVFDDLSSLWALRLHDNRLAALPAGVFDGTPNLIWLTLQQNRLASLSAEMFNELSQLRSLGLSSNPGSPFNLDLRSGIVVKDYLCVDEHSDAIMDHEGNPILDQDGNVVTAPWIIVGPVGVSGEFCQRSDSPLWDLVD